MKPLTFAFSMDLNAVVAILKMFLSTGRPSLTSSAARFRNQEETACGFLHHRWAGTEDHYSLLPCSLSIGPLWEHVIPLLVKILDNLTLVVKVS